MKRMFIYTLSSLLVLTSVCTGAYVPAAAEESAAVKQITAEEAKELLGSDKDCILVDVRTLSEYEEGHIEGAVLIPEDEVEELAKEKLPDKDASIILYCRSGRRSANAAQILLDLGYSSVMDLGGIIDWPYEIVTGTDEEMTEAPDDTQDESLLGSFTTTDLEGNTIDETIFSDYDLTMVNIWATYCGPCLSEMPHLGELSKEYADKNVQILGFVTDVLDSDGSLSDSQMETARDIVDATQASYTHLLPSQDLWGLLYAITSVPTTFFLDHEGKLTGEVYVGSRSKEEWSEILDETLGGIEP